MAMNRDLVGKEYAALPPFEVTAAAARAYAEASNALDLQCYDDAIAPPMYGVAFSLPALGAPLFDPMVHVDMMRLVHGEQDMRFLAPVRHGDVITARSKIEAITEKSSGEIIQVGITCSNQRGEVVLLASSGLFIRGSRKKESGDAPQERRADEDALAPVAWTSTEAVAADQSRRYAPASGDMNPIHTDEEVAKMAGLPGVILHGLCTMAFVHNACVRHVGGDALRVKRLAVRFARPVLMNDILSLHARGPATGPWQLHVSNQAGVVVLSHGTAEII